MQIFSFSVCSEMNSIFRDKHYMRHQSLKDTDSAGASRGNLSNLPVRIRKTVPKSQNHPSREFQPSLAKLWLPCSSPKTSEGSVCLVCVKLDFGKIFVKIPTLTSISPSISEDREDLLPQNKLGR